LKHSIQFSHRSGRGLDGELTVLKFHELKAITSVNAQPISDLHRDGDLAFGGYGCR